MGSNTSKNRLGQRPMPVQPRGIIRGTRPREPVPGHPGTYGNIQEQLFTTNNFAPAPRNPHNVNFRDQLVTPAGPGPARSRLPVGRPEPTSETPSQTGASEITKPPAQSRVDVLTPPEPVRHAVNRPPRDWENLRMISHAPPQRRYSYNDPGIRYVRAPVRHAYDGGPFMPRGMPRPAPGYPYPHHAFMPRQRPAYLVPEYMEDPRRPPRRIPGYDAPEYEQDEPIRPRREPARGIPGYDEAYIPPLPSERPVQNGDDISESENSVQVPEYGRRPAPVQRSVQAEPSRDQQPILVTLKQQQQPALVQPQPQPVYQQTHQKPVVIELTHSPPRQGQRSDPLAARPSVNGDSYEAESILSGAGQTLEDEHAEKYLSPREIELVSRSQPSMKDDDDDYIGANLRFYRNEISFRPNGEYIETIHKHWNGDYQRLANNTMYMPWLFPLPQKSRVNPFSEPMKQHEAKHIYNDREAKERVLTSYRMMLDFLGIQLVNDKTGQVKRGKNWKERFQRLKRSQRSHERITRMITSLGQLGFGYIQAPLVLFLLHETLETKELAGIPFATLKDWHHSIDNAFDANYVVDQFGRMSKKTKTDHVPNHVTNTTRAPATERDYKHSMPNISERVEPQHEDLFYRFDSKDTEKNTSSNHKNKDKRLTYREETDTNDAPKADVNGNTGPRDDVFNGNTNSKTSADTDDEMGSTRQQDTPEYARADSQTSIPDPVVSETNSYPQGYHNPMPRDNAPPPAYSEQAPY